MLYCFVVQRSGARRRGIDWQLSFEEWWDIWDKSGCFEQRGKGWDKYCMARIGDRGPYAVGNVKIITCGENVVEAHANRPRTRKKKQRLERVRI